MVAPRVHSPFETVEELIAAPFRLKINQPSRPTKETILNHFARLGLEPELYEKRSIEISGDSASVLC